MASALSAENIRSGARPKHNLSTSSSHLPLLLHATWTFSYLPFEKMSLPLYPTCNDSNTSYCTIAFITSTNQNQPPRHTNMDKKSSEPPLEKVPCAISHHVVIDVPQSQTLFENFFQAAYPSKATAFQFVGFCICLRYGLTSKCASILSEHITSRILSRLVHKKPRPFIGVKPEEAS